MNYCPRCGTRVTGSFCATCGRSTATAVDSASSVGSEDVDPAPVALSNWRPHPSAVAPGAVLPQGRARALLAWETRFVMFAFLVSGVIGAALVLVEHISGVGDISRFPEIVHHSPVLNMVLGMLAYVPVLSVVPLALFLLSRTGQPPSVMGLEPRSMYRDLFPALGLGAAALGIEVVMLLPFVSVLQNHPGLLTKVSDTAQPKYYLIEGVFMSAVTAVTEEVLVNGYFITRLGQLGWTPRSSLLLSLFLRTSYHAYYGVGFVLTIPLGFFLTRSFQKHHRLNRPVLAHFLYDAILFAISILK